MIYFRVNSVKECCHGGPLVWYAMGGNIVVSVVISLGYFGGLNMVLCFFNLHYKNAKNWILIG